MMPMLVTTATFALRLAVLAIANPVPPSPRGGGMAVPLTRQSSLSVTPVGPDSKSVDLAAATSHLASVRDKILRGGAGFGSGDDCEPEKDTDGRMHPRSAAMKGGAGSPRSGRKRGASVPVIRYNQDNWMCEISIGTPAKTLKVEIDTGSTDMFVFQSGCSSCEDRSLWDPGASESAEYISDGFRIKYADGTVVSGDIYTDNVTIAGYMADPHIFGAAKTFSSPYNYFVADGVLGMSFSSTSKSTGNLLATLVYQKKLFNPTFSMKLTSSGGELYVGGSNSQLYSGVITYTSVIDPSSGFWKVSMDDIRVGDTKILEDVPVILDSGANFIFGDWNRVATLYSRIGGKLMEHVYEGFGYYYLPCDSFPTLGFTFGGRSFEMPPNVFRLGPIEDDSPNCFGSIVAEDSPVSFWGVGFPFLQLVYTVFDYGTSQVGFADLA